MDQQLDVLKARLAEYSDRAQQIQANADQQQRDLTPVEAAEVDTIMEQFEITERQIQTRERIAGVTRPSGRRTDPNPLHAGGRPFPIPGRRLETSAQHALKGNRFADLFGPVGATTSRQNPFRSFGEYVMAAARDPLDPRLRQIRDASMTEGEGDSGGFGVPVQFVGDLLDAALEVEAIRPLCSVIPAISNMIEAPMFDVFDQTGGQRAGLKLAWADEGGTFTDQKAKLTPLNLRINKAGIFIRVTNELSEDMAAFERRLSTAMVNAIAAGLDLAFLFGTGAGTPLGVMNSPCLITQTKESQSAGTIVEDNVLKMASRLHPACWRNAVWLASPTALAQLYKLSQATGPNAGVRTAVISETDQGLRILGKQVIVTDACAAIGTAGDLVLGDFSRYLIGLRREARLETSIHVAWQTDELGVRMILRLGGQPEWKSAIKLRDGTNTVGCFVALEGR